MLVGYESARPDVQSLVPASARAILDLHDRAQPGCVRDDGRIVNDRGEFDECGDLSDSLLVHPCVHKRGQQVGAVGARTLR